MKKILASLGTMLLACTLALPTIVIGPSFQTLDAANDQITGTFMVTKVEVNTAGTAGTVTFTCSATSVWTNTVPVNAYVTRDWTAPTACVNFKVTALPASATVTVWGYLRS